MSKQTEKVSTKKTAKKTTKKVEEVTVSKVENGSKVTVHYEGRHTDGTVFDSSKSRNVPFTFEMGKGNVITGFETAVLGKAINEKVSVTVPPDQAYGKYSNDLVNKVPRNQLPNDATVGAQLQGTSPEGRPFLCTIIDLNEDEASLDLNHPLAGKELQFDIEILGVE